MAYTDLMRIIDQMEPIDWSDMASAHASACELLNTIATDKAGLNEMVFRVEKCPELMDMCECHALDDKIVLCNQPEKDFRLRLRLSNDSQYERAHTHRFSFTTLILHGKYFESWWESDQFHQDEAKADDLRLVSAREENAGNVFTIHHQTIHSTLTTPGTVSLILRGPAEKARAPIFRTDTEKLWYREGRQDESATRRAEVRMSVERYRVWRNSLVALGLI